MISKSIFGYKTLRKPLVSINQFKFEFQKLGSMEKKKNYPDDTSTDQASQSKSVKSQASMSEQNISNEAAA